jgi:hypothetical protein
MIASFAGFMLGVTIIVAQAAVTGLIVVWLASRSSRIAFAVGTVVTAIVAWASIVPLVDRMAGYRPESGPITNLAILGSVVIGWLAGRNRRVRAKVAAQPAYAAAGPVPVENAPQRRIGRLILDSQVRRAGAVIGGVAMFYGVMTGIATLLIELAIVNDAAGFWGFVIACVLAPFTFALAPLYAGVALGDWLPAALAYGGMLTMWAAMTFGSIVAVADQ